MNCQTRQRRPLSAYGSERAALVTLYAAKIAAVAALPAHMQAAARVALRAEEHTALRALKDKAAAERYAANAGKICQRYRAAARDVTEPAKRPARRRSRDRRRERGKPTQG